MATAHINANVGDFAKTVLMPGDPLRSKFIADNFLKNAVLVNNVRGVCGYTGEYNDVRVSVMASGMGAPSIGIYSYELFNFFDVQTIIRVGTAGGIADCVKLRDVVIAEGACTDSGFTSQYGLNGVFAPIADFTTLRTAAQTAERLNLNYRVGNALTTDVFYSDLNKLAEWKKLGVLVTEMETAALYATAARLNKRALSIFTVSDLPLSGEACSAEERQTAFTDMMRLSLETAIALEG